MNNSLCVHKGNTPKNLVKNFPNETGWDLLVPIGKEEIPQCSGMIPVDQANHIDGWIRYRFDGDDVGV